MLKIGANITVVAGVNQASFDGGINVTAGIYWLAFMAYGPAWNMWFYGTLADQRSIEQSGTIRTFPNPPATFNGIGWLDYDLDAWLGNPQKYPLIVQYIVVMYHHLLLHRLV